MDEIIAYLSSNKSYEKNLLKVCQLLLDGKKPTIASIQIGVKVGYNRACKLMDILQDLGVVSLFNIEHPVRTVNKEQLEKVKEILESDM